VVVPLVVIEHEQPAGTVQFRIGFTGLYMSLVYVDTHDAGSYMAVPAIHGQYVGLPQPALHVALAAAHAFDASASTATARRDNNNQQTIIIKIIQMLRACVGEKNATIRSRTTQRKCFCLLSSPQHLLKKPAILLNTRQTDRRACVSANCLPLSTRRPTQNTWRSVLRQHQPQRVPTWPVLCFLR
jgi:hypothetical protein